MRFQARHAGLFGLLVALAGCSKPAPDHQANTEALLAPFRGQWSVVSLDREGKQVPVSSLQASAEGEKFRLVEMRSRGGAGGGVTGTFDVFTDEYTIQVDPTKEAREADFVYALGDKTGQSRPGIYSFEGNRLKVCLGEVGGPRPADFVASAKTTLVVLERKP